MGSEIPSRIWAELGATDHVPTRPRSDRAVRPIATVSHRLLLDRQLRTRHDETIAEGYESIGQELPEHMSRRYAAQI